MSILLTYTSKTGNTKKVAEAIKEVAGEDIIFCSLEEAPAPDGFDAIVIGFWIDKGMPVAAARKYIKNIQNKKVAFFYTLGASPASEHGAKCLKNTRELFGQNQIIGEFACQGKVDETLIKVFKTLPSGHPMAFSEETMALYRAASIHPDENDLENACAAFKEIFDVLNEG